MNAETEIFWGKPIGWQHLHTLVDYCLNIFLQIHTISLSGLSALSRSFWISDSIDSRIANLHARWQISVKSAPLKPCVVFAKYSKSMS